MFLFAFPLPVMFLQPDKLEITIGYEPEARVG